MRVPWRAGALAVLIEALVAPGSPAGAPYLPLAIGNHWEYVALDGKAEKKDVTHMTEIFGESVYAITYSESDDNEGLENYWTMGEQGSVDLWGFYREDINLGRAYSPPIRVVDAPLYLGKVWTVTSDAYGFPGYDYQGVIEITYEVLWEGELTVPAGQFHAFGIGDVEGLGIDEQYGVTGARGDAGGSRIVRDWWSSGVGLVQYWISGTYQLTVYDLPTAVRPSSWGAIKRLYSL